MLDLCADWLSGLLGLSILVLTYFMLGWGLNCFGGLLDLGCVAFYAVGVYSYPLFAQNFAIGSGGLLALLSVCGFREKCEQGGGEKRPNQ